MTKPSLTKGKSPNRNDRAIAHWLWHAFVKQRLNLIFFAAIFMVLEAAALGMLSYMFQPMFDDVFIQGDASRVYIVAGGMAAIFFGRGLARLGHQWVMAWASEGATAELQSNLLAHLTRMDQGFFKTNAPGLLIERVRGDSEALRRVFTQILTGIGRDGSAAIVLFGFALWLNWVWAILALVAIPLLALQIVALQRLIRRRSAQARQSAADSSNRLDETFHGIATLQLTGSEAQELSRFKAIMQLFVRRATRAAVGQAAVPSVMDFGAAIGFALVLIYGGFQIIEGTQTVGQFMAFFTALGLLFDPLRRLTALSAQWQNVLASLERTYALLQIQPKITNPAPPHAPVPKRAAASVELRDVTFSYGQDPVLNRLSLYAPAGKTTAIVGPSGAGKTTIFSLLTRLADVDEGAVLIGGHDVRRMDLTELRALFAVVSQDTALFNESLRDNILMGAGPVSETALQDALRAAHVDDFLPLLPNGLDSLAGPRGSSLSGGQRQRVAIARAILRNAPILLLDEATSALDARSEAFVQDALEKLSEGRTTLVIAHRLSTVRKADQIIVMERGRLVEQGTHDALLAQGGVYARLYALQFGEDDANSEPDHTDSAKTP